MDFHFLAFGELLCLASSSMCGHTSGKFFYSKKWEKALVQKGKNP
ncbi:hypothetical protein V6Z11_D05G395800 [Gossypium hirsutum]